jgi:hypothetical protein
VELPMARARELLRPLASESDISRVQTTLGADPADNRDPWLKRRRDSANCRKRLHKLTLEAIQLIPAIDKGDPIRSWVDGVTRWVGGERVASAAEAASVAAAIEKTQPDLAVQLRGLASVSYQIPAALLSKTTAIATS